MVRYSNGVFSGGLRSGCSSNLVAAEMMRRALWLAFGVLVGMAGALGWARAETIAAYSNSGQTFAATHYYGAQWAGTCTLTYSTVALAQCQSLYAQATSGCGGSTGATGTVSFQAPLTCQAGGMTFGGLGDWYVCPAGSTGPDGSHNCTGTVYSCPVGENWTLSGTSCTRPDCTGDQVRNELGLCVGSCVRGAVLSSGWYSVGANALGAVPGSVCSGGCMYSFSGSCRPGAAQVGGVTHYFCKGSYDGMGIGSVAGCAGAPSSSADLPASTPLNCTGQCVGQFNGIDRCVSCDSTPSTTIGTTVTSTVNPDSSVDNTASTTSTTVGPGGVVSSGTTTTSGTTTPSGAPSGASTQSSDGGTTQDKSSFCMSNPGHSLCSAADPCKENPQRVGCTEFGAVDQEATVGSKVLGVTAVTPVTVGGSGSCPADVSLPHGVTWSWAGMCQFAGGIRPVVILLAWIAAAFIVMGAVKGG